MQISTKSENFGIVLLFISGFYYTILPFLPGGNPLSLIWTVGGIFIIIVGISRLYDTGFFSRKIYLLTLLSLVLVELFLILTNLSTSYDLIIGIILVSAVSLAFPVTVYLINKRETSKFKKYIEIVEDVKYKEALDYFDKYVKSDPNNPLAWSGKAITLLKLNKCEEALECSNKALEIKLGVNKLLVKKTIDSIRFNTKGIVLLELKKYSEPLECFDMVLRLKPNNSTAWTNKGRVLSELGNYEEAIKCYNKKLGFDPKDPYTLSYKGETLRKLGKYQEALEHINKSLEINSKVPFFWLNKGETLMAMNKNEKALEHIEKALELDPIFKNAIKAKEEVLKLIEK